MPAYSPDDAHLSPDALRTLASPQSADLRHHLTSLLAQRPHGKLSVADIALLRKSHPADLLHAALTLAPLQQKAAAKFPSLAAAAHAQNTWLFATPESLEQSSAEPIAAHKAARFAALAPAHIYDLCCGLGGDARQLAALAPTTAIDLSPPRTTCLQLNAQTLPPSHPLTIQTTDILLSDFRLQTSAFFHIDPARRSAGRRSPAFADMIPPPAFLAALTEKAARAGGGGAIKLSPAVDFSDLPPGHLELISHNASVTQAVLYLAALADTFPKNTRTATTLSHSTFSLTASPLDPQSPGPLPSPGYFLYDLDPAFTRAGLATNLAQNLNLTPLMPDAGYASSAQLLHHPALTAFEILEVLPFNESRLRSALNGPRTLEVKTRGGLHLNTDHLQKSLAGNNDFRRTLFLFRHQNSLTALITTRLPPP